MEADENKNQGRMTYTDSVLQVCMQVQGREADISGRVIAKGGMCPSITILCHPITIIISYVTIYL